MAVVGTARFYVLAHHDVGTQIHCHPDNQPDAHLPHDFEFAFQSVFVVAGKLHVVVEKTQQAKQQCRHDHQHHVHVGKIAQQDTRHKNGYDNDDAAHRRRSRFAHLPFKPEIAHDFTNLHQLEAVDDSPPDDGCNEYGKYQCRRRAECQIAEQSSARNIEFV